MTQKTTGRGGYRPGAGRKPTGTATEWTHVRVRVETRNMINELAAACGMTVDEYLDASSKRSGEELVKEHRASREIGRRA